MARWTSPLHRLHAQITTRTPSMTASGEQSSLFNMGVVSRLRLSGLGTSSASRHRRSDMSIRSRSTESEAVAGRPPGGSRRRFAIKELAIRAEVEAWSKIVGMRRRAGWLASVVALVLLLVAGLNSPGIAAETSRRAQTDVPWEPSGSQRARVPVEARSGQSPIGWEVSLDHRF